MIRYWEEDTDTEIGRPFDLEKHDKEISNYEIVQVKMQTLVEKVDWQNQKVRNTMSKSGEKRGIR